MAFMAWLGVACFVRPLAAPARFASLFAPLLYRPSLWTAVALLAGYRWAVAEHGLGTGLAHTVVLGAVGMLLCLATEPRCWRMVLPQAARRDRST
jgi:hypothetical protein